MAKPVYAKGVSINEREGKYGKFLVFRFTNDFFDEFVAENKNEDGSITAALFKTKDGTKYYMSLWDLPKPQEEIANTSNVPQPQQVPKISDNEIPF